MLDDSEIVIKELNHAIVNIYKTCIEELGYDMGETDNFIEYRNYLINTPLNLGGGINPEDDEGVDYTGLSAEEIELIKKINLQQGGEGLKHVGKFASKELFVKTMFNAFKSKGISSLVAMCMVAQAALESAWGTSHYAEYSNYGGINYHKGADFKIPGKSAHGHTKAGYLNVGRYIEEKLGIMERLYPGATSASTPQDYFRIIQGGNPNHYCYGGENAEQRAQYGKTVMNMISHVKKYLT